MQKHLRSKSSRPHLKKHSKSGACSVCKALIRGKRCQQMQRGIRIVRAGAQHENVILIQGKRLGLPQTEHFFSCSSLWYVRRRRFMWTQFSLFSTSFVCANGESVVMSQYSFFFRSLSERKRNTHNRRAFGLENLWILVCARAMTANRLQTVARRHINSSFFFLRKWKWAKRTKSQARTRTKNDSRCSRRVSSTQRCEIQNSFVHRNEHSSIWYVFGSMLIWPVCKRLIALSRIEGIYAQDCTLSVSFAPQFFFPKPFPRHHHYAHPVHEDFCVVMSATVDGSTCWIRFEPSAYTCASARAQPRQKSSEDRTVGRTAA